MGSDIFVDYTVAASALEAFSSLKHDAAWEHGHGGYTGTIAEKNEFKLFPREFGLEENPLDVAYGLTASSHANDDPICQAVNDKWGPAGAFDVTETAWGQDILSKATCDSTDRVYVFFGWASC